MLKVIREKRSNGYCGPAALSLLTGKSVDDCTALVRQVRQCRAVRSVSNWVMFACLIKLGHSVVPILFGGRLTLVGLARRLRHRTPLQRFLIRTTGHFLVLRGRKVYDNLNPTGVFFGEYNHRRYRVIAAWEVSA